MSVSFYMDVHVPRAVTNQLRRRGVDVLTAIHCLMTNYWNARPLWGAPWLPTIFASKCWRRTGRPRENHLRAYFSATSANWESVALFKTWS